MSHRKLKHAHAIADLRDMAGSILPKMVFDVLEGGAGAEETVTENRDALRRVRLVPRAPVDVTNRTTATTLFGGPAAFPMVVGPTGFASAFRPDGDIALARGAARAGIPFVMSTGAAVTPEELARHSDGRKWFQLYMPPDRELAASWLERVHAADFELLEVTVDGAVGGSRPRDARNGFSMPLKWTPRMALQFALKPEWALRAARHGVPTAALQKPSKGYRSKPVNPNGVAAQHRFDSSFDWEGVKWLRDNWKRPLVVKGLSDPQQVAPALEIGVDGIVVSNHGGRQLDGSVASIAMLPEFVAAADGRLTLLIDSGFRTGTDVLKGIALGASAIQIGRAALYGLTVAGEDGVFHALELFRREIDNAMALCGVTSPDQLTPEFVRIDR